MVGAVECGGAAPHLAGLDNVRAALDWCFGANGDARIGIGLAAAAAPVFLAMSLLPECHRWSERAIVALDGGPRRRGRDGPSSGARLVADVHPRQQRRGPGRIGKEP